MKSDSLRISKVFSSGGDVHYILPHFQREYAWGKEEWQTLITDVFSIYEVYASEEEPEYYPEHFMGSIVVINDGTRHGVIPAFKLVDGQQRLVSISLILCALGRIIKESHPDIARKIQKLLVNPDEADCLYFKVLPTTKYGDRVAYLAILKGEDPLPATESKIPLALDFFYKRLESEINADKIDPEKLFLVLNNCLQVVFIDLDPRERPYEIFESLNAKGKQLTQADLVRNYIAMRLPEARQEGVFETDWVKIESLLQERRTVARIGELTAFLRHYLAIAFGVLCNKDHVYERFRDRMERDFKSPDAFIEEIARLRRFAEYYDRLVRPAHEPDRAIREMLERLNILEISTAYPFLMYVYDMAYQDNLTPSDFAEALEILENYIVRRYLAGEPTNYLNKMFPTLQKEIDRAQFAASLRQVLVNKNYPTDSKLRQVISTHEIYDKRSQTRAKICLVLGTVNRYLSAGTGGYTILDEEPTIEHIMPQTLSPEWQAELGEKWQQTHSDYLHTLGNLTLVTQEWNTALSNSPFAVKKKKLAGHAIRLNKDYFSGSVRRWDEAAIHARADFITQQVLDLWPALGQPPLLPPPKEIKPRAVVILGQTFPTQSWRDVAYKTTEFVSTWVDNFDKIAEQMPSFFSREQFQAACRQLENGWWMYLNLSSTSVKNLCRRLMVAADIPEEDWQIEENTAVADQLET